MTEKQRKTLSDEFNNLHDVCVRELSDMWIVRKSLGVLCELFDWWNMTNVKRDIEVTSGNFVYYRVVLGTNIRKSYDGIPIIFESLYSAECVHDDDNPERVISVAAYNRRYATFVED